MAKWNDRRTGQRRGNRRGEVFPLRLTAEERAELTRLVADTAGPRAMGPWLVWAARCASRGGVLPRQAGYYRSGAALERVIPRPGYYPLERGSGAATPGVVIDLCAGSGAWSEPYARAGYRVERVTLPAVDVRTYMPPPEVHGILAAPPCTEFSLAKNGHERDLFGGLEVVLGCMRVIALARPAWWALENPIGLLGRWLGAPRYTFEPYQHGDPWTKRTAVWGQFAIPERGPFVEPQGSAMDRPTPDARAVTPPGFARAFFEANP